MSTDPLAPALPIRTVVYALLIFSIPLIFVFDPLPQDPNYHRFADTRPLWDIKNVQNVLSNLPFLIVGLLGWHAGRRDRCNVARLAWDIFFLATAMVSAGSAYYHWNPNSATLVWDRLPITAALMALLTAMLAEYRVLHRPNQMLAAAILFGLFSVFYWHYADDLRVYIWMQAVPLALIPILLLAGRSGYSHQRYLIYGLAAYVLAKVCELYDQDIYAATRQLVSGHTLKHLLAALGPYYLYRMIKLRARLD